MTMIQVQENVPLAPRTTFQIGGAARYFCVAKTEDDLRSALLWAREHGVPHFILGGGSNLLVPDEGLDVLVIQIGFEKWSASGVVLEADAGCNLLHTIRNVAMLGLGGWEKLSGIPGTVGGAIRGNAGAFGPEIKDFVVWVRALNTNALETHEFANEECEFAYRMSYFKKHPEWIILNAHLRLRKIDTKESGEAIQETIRERERRHIQNVRAAGSYFMNPVAPESMREMFEQEKKTRSREGRVPAGWLIEKAGMKGARVGAAEASEQHPNYLVNTGGATAREVRELAASIKEAVREQFGVDLQEEAVVL
jgi:UDP-N-acetylmuramate dehydrogenase